MKTCVFTPLHATGIRVAPMVKGPLRALAGQAAFVLRGTCTRQYRKCTY